MPREVNIEMSGSLGDVFFFQAEAGIRDLYVTGVQTCALPISLARFVGAVRSLQEAGVVVERFGRGRDLRHFGEPRLGAVHLSRARVSIRQQSRGAVVIEF